MTQVEQAQAVVDRWLVEDAEALSFQGAMLLEEVAQIRPWNILELEMIRRSHHQRISLLAAVTAALARITALRLGYTFRWYVDTIELWTPDGELLFDLDAPPDAVLSEEQRRRVYEGYAGYQGLQYDGPLQTAFRDVGMDELLRVDLVEP